MTILVTGASGNTGRRVVDRLVAAGRRVRAMTRDPQSVPPRVGVEVVRGDFRRPETWPAVLDGVERIYLFPFVEVDGEPGGGFVDLAVGAGVRRFVVHSAAAPGSSPPTLRTTRRSAPCGGTLPRNGRPTGRSNGWWRPAAPSGPMYGRVCSRWAP